jgi:hypothetical protein
MRRERRPQASPCHSGPAPRSELISHRSRSPSAPRPGPICTAAGAHRRRSGCHPTRPRADHTIRRAHGLHHRRRLSRRAHEHAHAPTESVSTRDAPAPLRSASASEPEPDCTDAGCVAAPHPSEHARSPERIDPITEAYRHQCRGVPAPVPRRTRATAEAWRHQHRA